MKIYGRIICLILCVHLCNSQKSFTQELYIHTTKQNKDSILKVNPITTEKRKNPKLAALLSIVPGAGQIYNERYWKLPIVYGILSYFTYNLWYSVTWYQRSAYAMEAVRKAGMGDSTDYYSMNQVFKGINYSTIKRSKDRFVSDINEATLYLLLAWGLNIIDAVVDAHLSNFDVSENLSLKLKPNYKIDRINNAYSYNVGIGAVLNIHEKKKKKNLTYLSGITYK